MDSPADQPPARIATCANPKFSAYKGRVRTGCLVCRARKVKCDEQRPICRRCIKSKRACVYKNQNTRQAARVAVSPRDVNSESVVDFSQRLDTSRRSARLEDADVEFDRPDNSLNNNSNVHDGSISNETLPDTARILEPLSGSVTPSILTDSVPGHTNAVSDSSPSSNHQWGSKTTLLDSSRCTMLDASSRSTRFHQTSHHIYWTLAVDWLVPSESPGQNSFSYFVKEVNCPLLEAFDHLNWTRMKAYIAKLGQQEPLVGTCILALQAVHRAQVDRLPMAHAISLYQTAIADFKTTVVEGEIVGCHVIFVGAFLLALCVTTFPNEDGPVFSAFDDALVSRLATWILSGHISPISMRIGAWMQFLHICVRRVGSAGVMPESMANLLSRHVTETPSLSALDCGTHPTHGLYDSLSSSLFAFYWEIQRISSQVADVSHYHRSRVTAADQAEVCDLLASVKTHMKSLWETRPSPLRLMPAELREQIGPTIANPLIALAGLCTAAYFVEVIVIGRTLGDPPPHATAEAVQAMKEIRAAVEGTSGLSETDPLSAGYVRPLFVYAIESAGQEEARWAIDRLRTIQNPLSRSGFVASLAHELVEAQIAQGRRVTTKAFCYQTFGVPPPIM